MPLSGAVRSRPILHPTSEPRHHAPSCSHANWPRIPQAPTGPSASRHKSLPSAPGVRLLQMLRLHLMTFSSILSMEDGFIMRGLMRGGWLPPGDSVGWGAEGWGGWGVRWQGCGGLRLAPCAALEVWERGMEAVPPTEAFFLRQGGEAEFTSLPPEVLATQIKKSPWQMRWRQRQRRLWFK